MDELTCRLQPYSPNTRTQTACNSPGFRNSLWTAALRIGHATVSNWKTSTPSETNRMRWGGEQRSESDAVLSSFKTMWWGRLNGSLNGCCYPVSLLHMNTSPLARIHAQTHTYACENTSWQPSAYTIPSYRCRTWVTQMCFPRISPLCTAPSVRMREDGDAEQSSPWSKWEEEEYSLLREQDREETEGHRRWGKKE